MQLMMFKLNLTVNEHVRFDERDVKAMHGWTHEAPADEKDRIQIGQA